MNNLVEKNFKEARNQSQSRSFMKCTNLTFKTFFISDPITFNRSLAIGTMCQEFCTRSPSPNIFYCFIVGVVIKNIAHIHTIAIHILAGLGKLLLCAAKLIYAIPAYLWGSRPNYQKTVKEALVHLGFSSFNLVDILISFRNIPNNYPQNLVKNVETIFARFLYGNDPLLLALLRPGDKSVAACRAIAGNCTNAAFCKALDLKN